MKRLALLVLLSGCVRIIPPPQKPEPVVPEAHEPKRPVAPGMGRVLIGTTSEPAMVEEITGELDAHNMRGARIRGTTYRKLCHETPCSVDLAIGVHTLKFTGLTDSFKGGEGDITVAEERSAYRYELGHMVSRVPLQIVAAACLAIGFMGAGAGTTLAVFDHTDPVTHQLVYPQELAIGIAVGGGVLLAASALIFLLAPNEFQNGSGVQWTL